MRTRFQHAVDRQLAARSAEAGAPLLAATAATSEKGHQLPWQPFSLDLLKKLTAEQATVLVDFTADW